VSEVEGAAFLISGPEEISDPGRDAITYRWWIAGKAVDVEFTGTAVAVTGEGLSTRAEKALDTQGHSEMLEFLKWKTPPDKVVFTTGNWPYIEGGELDDD
jgi:hypothetical protein